MYCNWKCLKKGCSCLKCGFSLKLDFDTPPKRVCRPPYFAKDCPHLGEATLDTSRIYGCGCPNSQINGITVTIFECAKFSKCVIYNCGDKGKLSDNTSKPTTTKLCTTCEYNPANTSHRENK